MKVQTKLNAQMILDKEFPAKKPGYDALEVDKYLDIIVDDYSHFEDRIPYEFYEAFNGQYLKVAIGKGMLTEEMINQYGENYFDITETEKNLVKVLVYICENTILNQNCVTLEELINKIDE